ncbi:MAG: hypothetical protein WC742_06325 [Gallionellaceae bacterium]|jgi:hypothetical protein
MANSQYFIAKDYLRAFDLKDLFNAYVVYYTELNFEQPNKVALSAKDRQELTVKLQETLNEIDLVVLKMKETKCNLDAPSAVNYQLLPPLLRANECRLPN